MELMERDYAEGKPQQTPEGGLSEPEAAARQRAYGSNRLPQKKPPSALRVFAGQFRDVMVLILLVCTVVSLLMGEYAEAVTVAVLVLLNALLGFLQERRTERTLQALAALSAPTARVRRDGEMKVIPADEVTMGDLLLLEAGDRIPADAAVLQGFGLSADESLLTGESEEIPKEEGAALYAGTVLLKGHGRAVVTAVGEKTKMGQIAAMLGQVEEPPTPLQEQLKHLGRIIAIGCLAACALVSVLGLLRGEEPLQMLLTGISLAVAAVPEGLPAIVTVTLALGVRRMAKKRALVRKLYAVETLGCTTVICADKTGTLTENRMAVAVVRLPDAELTVTPPGEQTVFRCGGAPASVRTHPQLLPILLTAALCNHASLSFPNGTPSHRDRAARLPLTGAREEGEPTETALLRLAAENGIFPQELAEKNTLVAEQPFDSERKRMSVCTVDQTGRRTLWVKGAAEQVLPLCTRIKTPDGSRPLEDAERKGQLSLCDTMSEQGLRVLAFALRTDPEDQTEQGLTFLGLMGLYDPPRADAAQAVADCRRAGIRVVMITGDHPKTAKAVAKKLAICEEDDRVCTGAQLQKMDDEALCRTVPDCRVYARVTPADKLRLVTALQKTGAVVAMTGDGVNDAPAIRRADIGVAMGENGTDVARSAADMVLTDDRFSTIVSAVREGRAIYANMRKFIRYLLSCNLGEVLTMLLAMLMGMPTPLLPIHILLMNLLTDGLPALALAVEPPEERVMSRRPRRRGESVFSHGMGGDILLRGCLIGLSALASFVFLLSAGGDLAAARTGAFLTLNLAQLCHVFECSREDGSLLSFSLRRNPRLTGSVLLSLLLIFCALYLPPVAALTGLIPLTLSQTAAAWCAALAVPVAVAVFRLLERKHK